MAFYYKDFEISLGLLKDLCTERGHKIYFGNCVSEHVAGELLCYKSRGDALRKNTGIIRPKHKRFNRRFYALSDIAKKIMDNE